MVWTGITRSADEVLREQSDKIEKNLQVLNEIKSDCLLLMEEINLGKATSSRLAQHLDRNWNLKTELGSLITSKEINELYLKCKNSGSMGGKLLGAGAGGFFLNVVSKSHSNDFRELLSDLVQVQFKLSQTGSRILLNIKGD
jgi:D-glycero-alpha-D-manno-heptose-7-phosphate kinase